MANFERHDIFEKVPEDSLPSWDPVKRRASELVDMMWVLKKKYDEMGKLLKYKARGTIRGDMEVGVDAKKGLKPEETFAPTVRHTTFKLLNAAATARAAKNETAHPTRAKMRYRSFDVPAAFLHGESSGDGRTRYVRPPDGQRSFDRRGVAIVWKLVGNCYGRGAAPRIWHKTAHSFLTDEMGMTQSEYDPCYYYKVYPDGSRLDLALYVDDGWVIDDAGPLADADLKMLSDKFQVKVIESPTQYLNINVTVESPSRVKLSSEGYIIGMADKYVPDWRSRKPVSLPATDALLKAYDRAHLREQQPSPELVKRYGGKVGAMIYTSPSVRVDACCAIARLSRALTFPTDEMEACADDVMVYLAQTASDGITFDGHAADAAELVCYSDSDWAIGHSTTGWCMMLAGAVVAYLSKRQMCIAMSSTNAEIIAASACAIEVVGIRTLLDEAGLRQEQPTKLYVDNSGAVELSRDRKSCHRSRHVDRRYFKVRELHAEGHVQVEHIDTAENPADLLTKPLGPVAYGKHRATLMNQGALRARSEGGVGA